jgi:hypothetical protein
MSTRASDVAARLGRSLAPTHPAAPRGSAPSGRRERFTVDLSSDVNDALAQWAAGRKRAVGRRVPKTEVARILIELLLEDAGLATRVEERLRTSASQ